MLTLIILVPILFAALLLARVVRLFTRPFRPYGRHYNPYGYNRGFGIGRRRHRFGRGLVTILGLVALDRLFTHRRFF